MRTGRRARHDRNIPDGARASPRSGARAVCRGAVRPNAADVRADRRHLLLCDLPAAEAAARKASSLISQLKKGDKVVTTGGIWGTVTNVGKETVTLQVAENAKIKVARDHILRVRGDEADD